MKWKIRWDDGPHAETIPSFCYCSAFPVCVCGRNRIENRARKPLTERRQSIQITSNSQSNERTNPICQFLLEWENSSIIRFSIPWSGSDLKTRKIRTKKALIFEWSSPRGDPIAVSRNCIRSKQWKRAQHTESIVRLIFSSNGWIYWKWSRETIFNLCEAITDRYESDVLMKKVSARVRKCPLRVYVSVGRMLDDDF